MAVRAAAAALNKAGGVRSEILAERLRRERAEADRAERENLLAEGKLVRVADVMPALDAYHLAAKTVVLTWPARMAPVLAAEDDARRVAALLDAEVRDLLQAMHDAMARVDRLFDPKESTHAEADES
ncbi:MAG: hypothetical protein MUC86_13995 [Burkholderiaceae bacterium]|nr:hypothetical protein [Burkholderiaceae bacterium]